GRDCHEGGEGEGGELGGGLGHGGLLGCLGWVCSERVSCSDGWTIGVRPVASNRLATTRREAGANCNFARRTVAATASARERRLPDGGVAAVRPRCALRERFPMDIKQDPNSIPNFNSGGRVGEAQRSEPEQIQSSVERDPPAGGDGATSEAAQHESLLDDGKSKPQRPQDPSKTGGGAIDGLV